MTWLAFLAGLIIGALLAQAYYAHRLEDTLSPEALRQALESEHNRDFRS